MANRDGGTVYHTYSSWKRVYCLFPKMLADGRGEYARGTLYRRTLEVDDCAQSMIFKDYITEKSYFKLKLAGEHKAKQF